ncbi:HAD family hydrolase [Flavobacteriaceae bacterium F08102]|nr:HAD family hydrolase [Flavobacteriaceae bacterium F08102]
MDGTLLNPAHKVSPHFFSLFSELASHIHFVAASGRQYFSIANKLAPITDQITIIAENGGLIQRRNDILFSSHLSQENLQTQLLAIRKIPKTEIILAGKKAAYVENGTPDFLAMFTEFYSSYKVVDDLTKVNDDIMKIALYHPESSEKFIYPFLQGFNPNLTYKVSGIHWLDIAENHTNKGVAISILQKELAITKEETMVFGDYLNDIEMFNQAAFSFAMQNAHKDLKTIAKYQTYSNENQGVEAVLEKLLVAKKGRNSHYPL